MFYAMQFKHARASNCIDLTRFGGKSPSELDIVDSSETVSQCKLVFHGVF